ncbi:MAG: ABC transporter ATP-binding protein [Actinomycetota bacterium]
MTETVLATSRLTAGYSDVPIIRDLDLRVDRGEVVALLGPNGAGKTTTMMTLAGEARVLGGTVDLFGSPATGRLHARAREGLAYLPEGRSVFGDISVKDNLRLGRGTIDAALASGPELTKLLGRRAGLLSGGEQQILGLARALAGRPRLLLADELSLGLAPIVVQRMLNAIRTAADDEGLGVLLVEQHAQQALAVADRGYVLQRGEIVLEGTADELLRDVERLTASYLSGE